MHYNKNKRNWIRNDRYDDSQNNSFDLTRWHIYSLNRTLDMCNSALCWQNRTINRLIHQTRNDQFRNIRRERNSSIDITKIIDVKLSCEKHDPSAESSAKFVFPEISDNCIRIKLPTTSNTNDTINNGLTGASSIRDIINIGKTIIDHENEIKFDKSSNKYIMQINSTTTLSYTVNIKKIAKLVKPLQYLDSMIGMADLKQRVFQFIVHFLQNENDKSSMYNVAIYGKPGVGKTDVGKIMCMIYNSLEIVGSDRVKIVKPSELIGRYIGETRQKTKEVLDCASGGILFIDEAYALMSGGSDKTSYGKECIDTINQELSENRTNLVVIIAGYEDAIENGFFKINEGLNRRFPFRYRLSEYSKTEMMEILVNMIKRKQLKISDDVTDKILIDIFNDFEYFDNFGGDIENLLTQCHIANSIRTIGLDIVHRNVLTIDDFHFGLNQFIANKKQLNTKSLAYLQMYC